MPTRLVMPVFSAIAFLGAASALAQQAAPQLARITVHGKEAGVFSTGGEKNRYILLDLGGATIKVLSSQDIASLNEQRLAQHRKRTTAFTETVKKLIEKSDYLAIKKAELDFKADSDDLLRSLGDLTAEGSMRLEKGEIEMTARLSPWTGARTARARATIEGQAVMVRDQAGKGHWTVENGSSPIMLSGPAALPQVPRASIRAHGTLRRPTNNAPLAFEAETIEVLK